MTGRRVAGLAGCMLWFAGPAAAVDFQLHNRAQVAVVGFQTREADAWSGNWLRDQTIQPGRSFSMNFQDDEGECKVRTRVELGDDTAVEAVIDYCVIHSVYVGAPGLTAD